MNVIEVGSAEVDHLQEFYTLGMTQPDVGASSPAEVPVVFISYAWTTEAHKARVLALRNPLRTSGVDALIDQLNFRDGEDTIHFMERIATNPKLKKVVVVCDWSYAKKTA